MKILQVHNSYQNLTGDDSVVEEEFKLLSQNGHQVKQFIKQNKSLGQASLLDKFKIAASLRSSNKVKVQLIKTFEQFHPDIVHVHNIFPLITPVIFEVCNELKIPVVQTLHNYRLLCINTLFYRNGEICEECQVGNNRAGVKYNCYNNSRIQSLLMQDVIDFHFKAGTWKNSIDKFICLSDFAKKKFIEGGLPDSKLVVKPNFVGSSERRITYEDFFLYSGKLEEQKGLNDFLCLAERMPNMKFKVVGFCANPESLLKRKNIHYLGEVPRESVLELMSQCRAILFLSKMYEGMPMTIIEAFANKKAVIARDLGAMKEMIEHNKCGLLFSSFEELCSHVSTLSNEDIAKEQGKYAFREYQDNYTSEIALNRLIEIYSSVVENYE